MLQSVAGSRIWLWILTWAGTCNCSGQTNPGWDRPGQSWINASKWKSRNMVEARQEEKGNHTKAAALSPSASNQLCHLLHREGWSSQGRRAAGIYNKVNLLGRAGLWWKSCTHSECPWDCQVLRNQFPKLKKQNAAAERSCEPNSSSVLWTECEAWEENSLGKQRALNT